MQGLIGGCLCWGGSRERFDEMKIRSGENGGKLEQEAGRGVELTGGRRKKEDKLKG